MAGKNIAAAVLAASIALPVPVFAQQNPEKDLPACTCETTYADPPKPLGRVLRTEGSVYVTDANGYQHATRGMALNEGTEVSTDLSGTARIMVGRSCPLDIEPNRQVIVFLPEGKPAHICVSFRELSAAAVVGPLNVGAASNALVSFGTTTLVISGGDDPASN